ncbi:MAG TPA: MobA/MobL family protein [Bryobacteraceae bacterium]|jgi:hypothetical protein|nr:MobA/MobL family protein [Bryobacteraceae bacterium]
MPNVALRLTKIPVRLGGGIVTALNWLEVGVVKRSDGHNVIARAAYNARERLVDERTGQVYDYRHLGEVEWKGILDPERAPDWVLNRERLWNATEQREDQSTRPDQARLARDFKIALPTELNAERRLTLTKDFAEYMASKGMVVDVAIHAPHAHNDDRNHHAHMLLTMREIGPEGFGNKVREWDKVAELNRWTERWSELGAEHLRRAGFHNEAERFKVGHLSRPERARLAHERGDMAHFEQLLNEPLRHRGPEASGMEKNGRATHIGQINREIVERNQVSGVPREIRAAYALSVDAEAFVKALEQKNMMLARITKSDVQRCAAEFALEERKYVPHYSEHQYVIATEQGAVYRLSTMTTGDSYKGLRDFMKPVNQRDYPSLEAALGEIKKRSLVPKVDREKVIADLMRTPDILAPSETPARILLEQSLQTLAGGPGNIPTETRQRIAPTPAVPLAANPNYLRGNAAQVWWAYNSTKTPEAFEESLKERGLHLARVTAEDAADSKTEFWIAKRLGRYSPTLREGEYVAVSDRGQAYRLTQRALNHEDREIKAFMGALDQRPMPSLREVQDAVQEKRQKDIAASQSQGLEPATFGSRATGMILRTGRIAQKVVGGVAEKAVGRPLVWVANAFESLLAQSISPEERQLAAVLEHEKQAAIERAERQRGGYGRGR